MLSLLDWIRKHNPHLKSLGQIQFCFLCLSEDVTVESLISAFTQSGNLGVRATGSLLLLMLQCFTTAFCTPFLVIGDRTSYVLPKFKGRKGTAALLTLNQVTPKAKQKSHSLFPMLSEHRCGFIQTLRYGCLQSEQINPDYTNQLQ